VLSLQGQRERRNCRHCCLPGASEEEEEEGEEGEGEEGEEGEEGAGGEALEVSRMLKDPQ